MSSMNFADSVNEMLKGKVVVNKRGFGYRITSKVLQVNVNPSAQFGFGWIPAKQIGFNSPYFSDLTENDGWKVYQPKRYFEEVKLNGKFVRVKDGLTLEKVIVQGTSQYFAKASDGRLFKVENNEEVTLL